MVQATMKPITATMPQKGLVCAVFPAVCLDFCIFVKHLVLGNKKAVAVFAALQDDFHHEGALSYEKATAEVLLREGKKNSPRYVLGCFRRPCVMNESSCKALQIYDNFQLCNTLGEKFTNFSTKAHIVAVFSPA